MAGTVIENNTKDMANDSQFAVIQISGLSVGTTLRAPIYDGREDRNVLLLSEGTKITTALLERLERRGISSVRVHKSELARITGKEGSSRLARATTSENSTTSMQTKEAVERAAAEPTGRSNHSWEVNQQSYLNLVKKHGSEKIDQQRKSDYSQNYQNSVSNVEGFYNALISGKEFDPNAVIDLSADSLMKITDDLDLFVSLGIQPGVDKYPSRHSVQTAMLAMSMGTTLGLTQDELIELGIGCLIHDAGMLYINQKVVQANRKLGSIEFLEITKHPLLTFDMIRDIQEIPTGSRMVAYQMHERYNGTGYPRGRRENQIHYLARISAVADVFIALVSLRPHRPGILPYLAMEQLIKNTRSGLFDPNVVRALLNTISLFPLGSSVELSDGRVGNVIRANGDQFTKPVVELWTPGDPEQQSCIVDLSREFGIEIVQALEKLELETNNS